MESLMRASGTTNPRLKAVFDQYALIGKNARVFAFKLDAKGFVDSVNILAVPASAGLGGEHIGNVYGQVKQALESKLGATIIDHRVESVAGTKALSIEYRLPVAQRSVHVRQVYVTHRGKLAHRT